MSERTSLIFAGIWVALAAVRAFEGAWAWALMDALVASLFIEIHYLRTKETP